jgi:predicted dehydrogenase
MLQTQRCTGKICMTAFKKRFAPAYMKAKAVINSDDFGQPALLTITRTSGHWGGSDDTINTYLRENSIHVVDLAAYLFGPVKRVAATGRAVATAVLTLEYENGGIGTVAVTDRMSYQRGWEVVTAVGDGGVCIEVDNSVEMNAFKLDHPITSHKPEFVAGGSLSAVEQGFAGELQAFVDAIRSGAKPDASIEHVTHAMAILHAVREALETGRSVDVEPIE